MNVPKAQTTHQMPEPKTNSTAIAGSSLTTCSPSSEVDTAPEQWRSQCLVARIQRDEVLELLRRIARKGEFMDREGLRLTVSDWLARRHLLENAEVTDRPTKNLNLQNNATPTP